MIVGFLVDNYLKIVAFITTCLVTGGVSFLFHPAILVFYHNKIDHTITVLRNDAKEGSQSDETFERNEALLTLVIPAYNEEDRLNVMLEECYAYLCKKECPALENLREILKKTRPNQDPPTISVEWMVVNDGSSDKTIEVFKEFAKQANTTPNFVWTLVALPINEGKGAAVQTGMMEASGAYRLMVDADGATTFDQGLEAVTRALLDAVSEKKDEHQSSGVRVNTIVFGSRAGDNVKRSRLRQLLMNSFLWLRSCVVGTPVSLRDTQCGFKLFDASSAADLFSNLHLRRWAFDIELVYVALKSGLAISEVVVPWHEVDGSKLNTSYANLLWVSIGMLRDMVCVRACYVLGIWKIRHKQ